MRKGLRVGIIILCIGLSLLFVSFIRSNSTESISVSFMRVPANNWSITHESYLFPPKGVQLIVDSNSTINVYFLDSDGMMLWNTTNDLRAVASFENILQETLKLQIENRGEYYIMVNNLSNSSIATANVNITFYGFEKDLAIASLIITVLGLITMPAIMIQQRYKKPP